MEYKDVPNLRRYFTDWSEEIRVFRQSALMGESQFLTFAKDRGLPVWGVVAGDPGEFFKRGWLEADETDSAGNPRFHPFRVYPLHRILKACDPLITRSAWVNPESIRKLSKFALEKIVSIERVCTSAAYWNSAVSLAVLLEPVYWPRIEGSRRLALGMSENILEEAGSLSGEDLRACQITRSRLLARRPQLLAHGSGFDR